MMDETDRKRARLTAASDQILADAASAARQIRRPARAALFASRVAAVSAVVCVVSSVSLARASEGGALVWLAFVLAGLMPALTYVCGGTARSARESIRRAERFLDALAAAAAGHVTAERVYPPEDG